jgi:hypothetical protein
MQRTSAHQALSLPDLIGKVQITGKQQIMEGGVGQQG